MELDSHFHKSKKAKFAGLTTRSKYKKSELQEFFCALSQNSVTAVCHFHTPAFVSNLKLIKFCKKNAFQMWKNTYMLIKCEDFFLL